jgi:hypothetical protein
MTTPFIHHEELARRLEPFRPLIERLVAGESVTWEEWEEANRHVTMPDTYRTRHPGWHCDITISPEGTTVHLPGRDVLVCGDTADHEAA